MNPALGFYFFVGIVFTSLLLARSFRTDPLHVQEESLFLMCLSIVIMVMTWPWWFYIVVRKGMRDGH